MTRYVLSLALAYISLAAHSANAGELKVEPDKENVVASRLEGTWQSQMDLTKRLTGKVETPPGELPFKGELSFKSDPSVAEMVPEQYAKFFAEQKKKIYLAGYLKFDGQDHPFVVTQIHGNPHVIVWLEKNGDPFGNGESFNVMLAVAKDKQNDLLFVGGDFNNQPFSAFERVKSEPDNNPGLKPPFDRGSNRNEHHSASVKADL